ncbi:MAG: hypothetical protein ACU0CA_15130 [Paracoccaceae bacterium]
MILRQKRFVAAMISSLVVLASCQTTLGVGGISGGTAVGVSTTVGNGSRGTYLAQNWMRVVPDPAVPGRFEVMQRAGNGGSGYWCAAGQYVIVSRGMRPGTRIYLDQPIGPGKMGIGSSIGFTVAPDAELQAIADAQSNGLVMSMKRIGENWSAEHSRSQCAPIRRFGFYY